MRKIIIVLFSLLILSANADNSLKGGVSEEYIPKGFFGSWGVISKLKSSDKPEMFNFQSKDVWVLSGYSNILILENLESGAYSEITIKDKNKDGKTLNFEREKTVQKNGQKIVYKETVSFILSGNFFSGTDTFIVETVDNLNNKTTNKAIYQIEGVKISGSNP